MFKFVLLLPLFVAGTSALATCLGNCGVNTGAGCRCDEGCVDNNSCCPDYNEFCFTCANGRCGEGYYYARPCQCNVDCTDHGNCCDDWDTICADFVYNQTLAEAIIDLTEELFTLDVNSVGTKYTIDLDPPGPLFTSSTPDLLSGPTISTMVAIRDNYVSDTSVVESDDANEAAEKNAFLDAIETTAVMNRTEQFLWDYGLIPYNRSLREVIDEIFFTYYTRAAGPKGTNGFEHTFLGEIDDGQLKGYHNWISWYIDESEGELIYNWGDILDISDDVDGILMASFDWIQNGTTYSGPAGTMLIGTSPELELAQYAVCFFAFPNSLCDVSMNGVAYAIQTYTISSDGLTLVGSIYPTEV